MRHSQLITLEPSLRGYAIQVEDGLFLVPPGSPEPANYFNHSCDPNAGLSGQLALVALRPIQPGEEVCFDYAMCNTSLGDGFACCCCSVRCRGVVTNQDWRNPELWVSYAGHFSPYLQQKIGLLRQGLEPAAQEFQSFNNGLRDTDRVATHYLSPRLVASQTPSKGQYGVYAKETVHAGELLTVWGGMVVTTQQLFGLEPYQRYQAIQVEEGLHLAPFGPSETADYFNHSCNLNAGLLGQNCLIALRDILAGEEVCFDYGTSDSTPYDEFQCSCGEANCRLAIQANSWRLPELWERYQGHFSPYLQRRIDALNNSPGWNG